MYIIIRCIWLHLKLKFVMKSTHLSYFVCHTHTKHKKKKKKIGYYSASLVFWPFEMYYYVLHVVVIELFTHPTLNNSGHQTACIGLFHIFTMYNWPFDHWKHFQLSNAYSSNYRKLKIKCETFVNALFTSHYFVFGYVMVKISIWNTTWQSTSI